jgi:hypothetical protein
MEPTPSKHILGNWNANIFTLKGRKCLIVMNDETYYSLLFLDILKADFLNFGQLFSKRLIEQIDYDDIKVPIEITPTLSTELQPRFLPTNNNRKVLGTMKEFVLDIEYYFHNQYYDELANTHLPELNHRLTNNLVGALKEKKSDFGKPIEEMQMKLNQISV